MRKRLQGRVPYILSVLVLTIPLMLALNSVARDMIATPILYVLWLGRPALRSIPQPVIWALLLAMASRIALKALSADGKPTKPARAAQAIQSGRVAVWARWIRRSTYGSYSRWHLSHELANLMLGILDSRDRLPRAQFRQRLEAGELDVPPEIRAYLLAGLQPISSGPPNIFARLVQRYRPRARTSPLDLSPESVVRLLEDQLEVQRGRRNR